MEERVALSTICKTVFRSKKIESLESSSTNFNYLNYIKKIKILMVYLEISGMFNNFFISSTLRVLRTLLSQGEANFCKLYNFSTADCENVLCNFSSSGLVRSILLSLFHMIWILPCFPMRGISMPSFGQRSMFKRRSRIALVGGICSFQLGSELWHEQNLFLQ